MAAGARASRAWSWRRRWAGVALAAMLVAALSSCGDSTGPDEWRTSVTLQINVFSNADTRFEWVPRCLISEVVVFEEGTGNVMWTLFSSGGERPNTIESGLEYGEVPRDTEQDAPAQVLTPGTTYRVSLSATSNGEVSVIGSRTFVR